MAWENSTSDGHHGIQQHLVIELPSPTVCKPWVNVGKRLQTMGERLQTSANVCKPWVNVGKRLQTGPAERKSVDRQYCSHWGRSVETP
jgi:hypothetical protein